MNRIQQLRTQREAILRLAGRYGIRRVRVFGSVARGEDHKDSDVDVLVDFEPGRSLLRRIGPLGRMGPVGRIGPGGSGPARRTYFPSPTFP